MRVALDTHALLWWQAKHKRLSRVASRAIDKASSLVVSAITCWEVATLVAQGRIVLDRPLPRWLADMEQEEKIELLPLSPRAAISILELDANGFHADPADRLIYATAATEMIPLISADERIAAFAKNANPSVRVIW